MIEGTVRYLNNTVMGVTVMCSNGHSVNTDVNGHYQITDLDCGADYTLTVNYNGTSQQKTVTTPSAGGSITVDFNFGTASGNTGSPYTIIMGKVRYNGTVVEGASVSANVTANGVWNITDSTGNYTLKNLPNNASINVTATYKGASKTLVVTTPKQGGTIVINLDIEPVAPLVVSSSSNSNILIWLSLLALVILVIAGAYVLYTRNK